MKYSSHYWMKISLNGGGNGFNDEAEEGNN